MIKPETNLPLYYLLLLILCTSCAPEVDVSACIDTETQGFWYGLWHGFILPFSFIISLFNEDIGIYAISNNGGWYNFGFVLGASLMLGGSSRAKK